MVLWFHPTGSLEKGEVRPGLESWEKGIKRAPSGRERDPSRRIMGLYCSVVQCAAQPKSLTLAQGGHMAMGPWWNAPHAIGNCWR